MVKTRVVSVGTVRSLVSLRGSAIVRNLGTAIVYIGDGTITADTADTQGFQLAASGGEIELASGNDFYAVTPSSTAKLLILEGI